VSYRLLRDTRSKELSKVGVVAIPVTLVDQPLWYLLTADPIRMFDSGLSLPDQVSI
jgi:hypothetical protein